MASQSLSMPGNRHDTMRCFATLLACAALLSTTFARVLPKVKRDNTTCCGYKLTNRDDMRFRYQHVIDFSAMTSLDQVYQAGWGISNGWQTGGTNPSTGQYTVASESNVKIVPGQGLTLTIPGGQSPSAKTFSGAEISFPYTVLGGYFEIEARITSLRGTVFGMFTSHADPWDAPRGWQDSQFIEILSSSLMLPTPYTAAGMQLTNYDPHTGSMYRTVAPFPSDPVASTLAGPAYHKWSIAWLPTLSCPALNQPGSTTKYRYDGNLLNGPTAGSSKNPSTLLLSFWTNADPQFSVGPPSTNAVITIKQIRAYYDTPNKIADGACPTKNTFDCTVAMSCPVTVF